MTFETAPQLAYPSPKVPPHAPQSPTATTIRVRDGQRITTDGPFMETREALGGYYILECADLDEAIAWAARIPGAADGAVELRPIRELPADMVTSS